MTIWEADAVEDVRRQYCIFRQREEIYSSSGSKSRACIEGKIVNVGDPLIFSKEGVPTNKCKSKEVGTK